MTDATTVKDDERAGLRPIENMGKWCVWLIKLYIFWSFLLAAHSVYTINFVSRWKNNEFEALTETEWFALAGRYDQVSMIVGVGFLVILAICYVQCGRWIYRASFNAGLIEPHQDRIGPGWSVGWFFIPIATLWMPFKAMRQTWNTSINGFGALNAPAPRLLKIWWACWVIASIVGQISFRMGLDAPFDDYDMISTIDLVTNFFDLISAFMFLRIVKQVTYAQVHQQNARLGEVFA